MYKLKTSWKRHAGAVVLITLFALRMFGVDVPPEAEKAIATVGAGIFGYGWLDRAMTGPHLG